jgi:small nuclear ribonucleoprotein (snRNP)-like protein
MTQFTLSEQCCMVCLLLPCWPQVVLPSGRVIEGDLACLDKQGNLILSNAVEHILTASSSNSSSSSSNTNNSNTNSSTGSSSSGSSSKQPQTTQLGMVLVPKAQQQEVSLRVSLSEKTAMLSLTSVS